MKVKILFVLVLVFFLSGLAFADDIKGYMIPEYYMVGSHHSGEEGIEGQHGFWLRRIYFGYNTSLGSGWSARVRFEMNSPAYGEGKIEPFIKNAHLKKKLGGGANLLMGIIDPPSFDKIEKFWGLRFIEKTAPDFFNFASSRDFGIALDGKSKGGLVYTLMYGNFSSNKSEDNKGKAFYGRLGWEAKTAYVEANGHFAKDNGKDITYLTAFGGMKGGWGRFGLGYHYKSEKPEGDESKSSGIISGFAVVKIGKKSELFARYDHFTDPNFKDIGGYVPIPANLYDARYLMAGLNFKVHKLIQVSPNVRYVFYGGENAPDGDFYFTLTAKIDFKTGIGKK
ncbi:MAG: porin [Candidatus Aminicenantes bacterium]|nr:porin [Candidatus Aminicenantes bacterium]